MHLPTIASGPFRLNVSIVLLTLLVALTGVGFDLALDYRETDRHTRNMVAGTVSELTRHVIEDTGGRLEAVESVRLEQMLRDHLHIADISVFAAIRDNEGTISKTLRMDQEAVAALEAVNPLLDRTFVERDGVIFYPVQYGRNASIVIGYRKADVLALTLSSTATTLGFVLLILSFYFLAVFRRVRNEIERPLARFFDQRLTTNLQSIIVGSPRRGSEEEDLGFLPASLRGRVRDSLNLLDVWTRHKTNLDEFIAISTMETSKPELAKNLFKVLCNEFPLANLTVLEINQSQNRLQLTYTAEERRCKDDIYTAPERCMVFRSGSKLVQHDEHRLCEACMQQDERITLCAPLVAGSKQMGVCKVVLDPDRLRNYCRFVPEVRDKLNLVDAFLTPYLNLASLTLSNLTLLDAYKNQALTDALTGLYNRRYLVEYMNSVLSLSKRNSAELAVFMIDVDNFKRLNDEFGHDMGDQVLRTIARTMRDNIRDCDIIGRYGGEEFVVVLPETGDETATAVAERVRESVASIEWDRLGLRQLPRITISIGIAHFPVHGYSHYHLTNSADRALYKAKQSGKNRVVVHEHLPDEPVSGVGAE